MDPAPRMLITAGPTHEPVDPVRYLANRSSGKMGFAMVQAARSAGWDVTLLLGPVTTEPPAGVEIHRYTTVADLEALLAEHFPRCDALVMAASVADYRPSGSSPTKLPRAGEKLILELEPTPDLVAGCATRKREGQLVVGFALEGIDILEDRAADKLVRKKLDAIVGNPLETMGSEEIDPIVRTAQQGVRATRLHAQRAIRNLVDELGDRASAPRLVATWFAGMGERPNFSRFRHACPLHNQ